MEENPFTQEFGSIPASHIQRKYQLQRIIHDFSKPTPTSKVHILKGVRGSGKTVALTELSHWFKNQPDWIVLDISPERSVMDRIETKLSIRRRYLSSLIGKIHASLCLGPVTLESDRRESEMADLTKKGKKVLITIDEVTATKNVRELTAEFQIWIRNEYSVFLLMAGLYENIDELKNKKSLTYLYRAPYTTLAALDALEMSRQYQKLLDLDEAAALKLAKATKGYPYAYKLLGYVVFQNKQQPEKIFCEFDQALREGVYEKIWFELSPNDKRVLLAMANAQTEKVSQIRELVRMDSNHFGAYRNRLIRKGLLVSDGYAMLRFALPRFKEFILYQQKYGWDESCGSGSGL